MTLEALKITSMGSQYSTSNDPTVPNATPVTDAAGDESNTHRPPVDLEAVAKKLEPVQGDLNEAAIEAGYPSPPHNTPYILSPAGSVSGFSVYSPSRKSASVAIRLARSKLEGYKGTYSDVDGSASVRSFGTVDDKHEVMSNDDAHSDAGGHHQGVSLVPLMLSPPAANPLVTHYLAFNPASPAIMPLDPAVSLISSTLVGDSAASLHSGMDSDSVHSGEGVAEKSNWAEEVEDNFARACMRLEQLARDEYAADPSKSVRYYYHNRLERLVGSNKREFPFEVKM